MLNWILSLVIAASFAAPEEKTKEADPNVVLPDCKFVKPGKVSWEIAVCKTGEKRRLLTAEVRLRTGKALIKYLHVGGPTGGIPSAELLQATERFAIFQLGGSETNRIVAVDLQKKTLVLNTGDVSRLGRCQLRQIDEKQVCAVTIECDDRRSDGQTKISFHEFLCP